MRLAKPGGDSGVSQPRTARTSEWVRDLLGFVYLGRGQMKHANAANPAPYCNGQEMAVECGVPLGLVPEVMYEEKRYAPELNQNRCLRISSGQWHFP